MYQNTIQAICTREEVESEEPYPFEELLESRHFYRFVSVAPILTEVDCELTDLRRSLRVGSWTGQSGLD